MSLHVHPDPEQPAGGFAFLEVPDGSLQGDTAMVAVFDAYGERWLGADTSSGGQVSIGDPNWQPERHEFGPYQVYRHEGADWVRIGPEIVNKIEEYAPLKIEVAGASYDVTWPDDVPPRAGAASLGGLAPVSRKRPEEDKTVLVRNVQADPVAPPQPDENMSADTVVPPPDPSRGRGAMWLSVLLLLLIAAGAAAWYLWPEPDPVAETAVPIPVANSDPDQCTPDALGALQGGFGPVAQAIRDCGKSVSPDTALGLIEYYAEQGDSAALMLMGTLYDGTELDARIENLIGLSFTPDDARAAEYYARARDAGETGATTRLSATCSRLEQATSTLAKGAFDDFCG